MRSFQRISIVVSAVLGGLFLLALGCMTYWLPVVVNSLINVKDNIGNRNQLGTVGRNLILADAYLMVAIAVTAVVLLFVLLRVVYQGRVFSTSTTHLLSTLSWCCFGEALLTLLLIVQFQLIACLSLAAGFLGLCLRVVKHVIEEATRIKNENDFTI